MLYVTTRDKYDAFTAYRAKMMDKAPDGGLYVPYRMPAFSREEAAALKDCGYGKCVAQMLNRFFSTQLTGWDVEFCVGRYPVRISSVTNKVIQLETWRNLDGSYEKMERNLAALVCSSTAPEVNLTSWLRIAIRISVLVGSMAELLRQGFLKEGQTVDIAVPEGDFSLAMAVWYGRQMGLPVANIICSCADNSVLWDLLHLGEFRINSAQSISTELERLVYGTLGVSEAVRYGEICAKGGVYTLLPHMTQSLRSGIFGAVVSRDRLDTVISSVYHTSACVLEQAAAAAYGGLMDYRASTGESRPALIFSDRNPADEIGILAAAMKMPQAELKKILDSK